MSCDMSCDVIPAACRGVLLVMLSWDSREALELSRYSTISLWREGGEKNEAMTIYMYMYLQFIINNNHTPLVHVHTVYVHAYMYVQCTCTCIYCTFTCICNRKHPDHSMRDVPYCVYLMILYMEIHVHSTLA